MPRKTPFHPRTEALCASYAWKEWAGYHAVSNYDRHSEREYFAIRHAAGLIDVTPLYKYDVTGPDAGAFLSRIWCRDVADIRVGRVVYSAMADERGKCVDDGTISRLGPQHYRATSSEPWMHWLHRHARGFDVQIEDTTDRIAALAIQGPNARAVLKPLVDFDMDRMRFFRVQRTKLAGHGVWVSRTGYTGDLGYEVWTDNADALAVWDALMEEGALHGLEPFGLDALDVVRIEAGFVLQGIDYISARSCIIESRKSSPFEAGLGWTVELDREPFIGKAALEREREAGSRWALVGLELSWPGIEAVYDRYGLPPHLAPTASRAAVPIYDASGNKQVGQVTSSTWSPLLKRSLAIGQVYAEHGAEGTELMVEHTPEFERCKIAARVVPKPFFDPERKRHTPKKGKPPAKEPR
jgi:aminomethyltransferase